MESLKNLFSKLNKFSYVEEYNHDKGLVGNLNGREISIKMSTDYASSEDGMFGFETMPVQVQYRIWLDGVFVQIWGSTDNEMNGEMVKWFMTKRSKAMHDSMKLNSYQEKHAQVYFDKL